MRLFWRLAPYVAGLLATAALGIAAAGFAAYYYLTPALPSVEEMREIPLQIPLRIYTRDGRLMEQIGEKRRSPVNFEDIPEIVVQAFLAAEDDRFFDHPGFDYQGILRAAINLAITGSKAQGGSTITQQLAREYFLTRDRTFIRKAKELILAIQIEKEFTKQEILALYLNKIFLGQRSYGVVASAEVYFGKNLGDLSVAEAATIAGLPAAPSRLNPVSNPDQSRDRRGYVLRRMRELGFIDEESFTAAINTPVESRLHGPRVDLRAPYVAEMIRSEMLRRFGTNTYIDGYQVITTIDSSLQRAAGTSLRKALFEYDRRHGFRGPVAQITIDELIADYLAEQAVDGESLTADTDPEVQKEITLQDYLNGFPVYPNLNIAIVTATLEDNSAELFLRDKGTVTLAWDQILWRRYINDDVIGAAPENIDEMLQPGDVVYLLSTATGLLLGQLPEAQGAFVAMDPKDGATLAMTGGFDYYSSKYNRAVQAKRQPGSSFKPFIYSAALENGFTAATVVLDAPVVLDSAGQEESWRPENYSNRFYGPTRLREGLVRSMNLVSVRVLREVGLRNALKHLKPFGFPESALPRDLALALGSGGASPWQMAEGFAGLASGGYSVDRYLIDRVLDADGNIVYRTEPAMVCSQCAPAWFDGREKLEAEEQALPEFARKTADTDEEAESESGTDEEQPAPLVDPEVPDYASSQDMIAGASEWHPDFSETPEFWADRNQAKRIISPQNAYIVYDMMRDVINRGTGRRARELGRRDIGGKTGTSNNRRDAWFSGFNHTIVGIAWVGFDDDSRSLGAGEEGSRTALPMWKDFMKAAIVNTPEAPLEQPSGIVTVRISPETGLAAPAGSSNAIFEIFRIGNEPQVNPNIADYNENGIFDGEDEGSSIF
ncbi:MAG: peptidase [Chromatiales bacterium]|nr:peptidase [Chromatiales bacterium]